jgi:hypothetical protein
MISNKTLRHGVYKLTVYDSCSCTCICITNHFFSLTDTAASASAILLQQADCVVEISCDVRGAGCAGQTVRLRRLSVPDTQ